MTNRRDLNSAIAFLVHEIRPDWGRPGIEKILGQLDDRPLVDVVVAAVTAADSRLDQRTPAVIAATGSHWRGGSKFKATPEPPPYQPPTAPALPPATTAAYAARARAAIGSTKGGIR